MGREERTHRPNAGEAAVIWQAGLEPYDYGVLGEDWRFLRLRKRKTGEPVAIDKERRMVAYPGAAG